MTRAEAATVFGGLWPEYLRLNFMSEVFLPDKGNVTCYVGWAAVDGDQAVLLGGPFNGETAQVFVPMHNIASRQHLPGEP